MRRAIPWIALLPFALPAFSAAQPSHVKLASIQKGYMVDEDDQLARRFDVLLDNVSETFPEEDRAGVGDVVVKMQNMLDERGIDPPTLRQLMEGINRMFAGENPGVKLTELAAAYVTLRSDRSVPTRKR